jgi:uncharacterized protein YaiI (UPF0178 family)
MEFGTGVAQQSQLLSVGYDNGCIVWKQHGRPLWLTTPMIGARMDQKMSSPRNEAGTSIWVDADACPKVIKDILYRAAERTGTTVTFVANQPLTVPRIASLRVLQVSQGFDVADNEIVKRVAAGDLVITADIPLAAEVIAKGGNALNPRGERYSPDTIRGVLNLRDFMDTMRASGNVGGGPPPLTQANRNAFASHLDTWLASRKT